MKYKMNKNSIIFSKSVEKCNADTVNNLCIKVSCFKQEITELYHKI